MKKLILILMTCMMMLLFVACGGGTSVDTQNCTIQNGSIAGNNVDMDVNDDVDDSNVENVQQDTSSANTVEKLEDAIALELENWITRLQTEWKSLETEINSYELYVSNIDKVEGFYNKIYEETKTMCNKLRGYSVKYAEIISSSDMELSDMYNEAEIIYDSIYEEAGDEIYDEIYNGILDDMYDAFYNGVVKEGYDQVPYAEYSNVSSDAYSMNVDVRSDVYDECLDMRSDVYDFSLDFRAELWDKDLEKAKEEISDFKEDIDE